MRDEPTAADRRRMVTIVVFLVVTLVVAIALAYVYAMPSAD